MESLVALLVALNAGSPRVTRHPSTRPAHVAARESAAQELFEKLNAGRQRAGRKALAVDARLEKIAKTYARKLLVLDFVGHETPDGETLAVRLQHAAYRYKVAGENIMLAISAEAADRAFWNSHAHRENMLSERFGRVGIAALPALHGWTLVVEDFSD
jgi:uncharacterized protein YkwD